MSDPLRTDGAHPLDGASSADRDAKIEQLLLAGLDHYFATQYDQAINVWTRALFLDRSHPRARAFIERARGALAERQRQGEELLHGGREALRRGEPVEARRLLTAAVSGGAAPDEAMALLGRLDHLQASAPAEAPPVFPVPRRWSLDRSGRPLSRAWLAAALLAAAAALFVGVSSPLWSSLLFTDPVAAPAVPSGTDVALTPPRRGEMALARAQALASAGRLRDGLAALDGVRPTDPERAEADRLRSVIQHQLIGLAFPPGGLNTDLTGRRLP